MLKDVKQIHFIGIGGIGVSAVARVALAAGYTVSGSDVIRSSLTESIAAAGAQVEIGHSPKNLTGADLVVVSTAIPEENIEWVSARERDIRIVHRSEVLAELVTELETIGVTGTHGKGTTAAMIAWILDRAGRKPGFIIGGLLNNYGTNAQLGDGPLMVLEVDESDGSHRRIPSRHLVCNYLEADHLNYYRDLDHIIEDMIACVNENSRLERVFVNSDCGGNRRLIEGVDRPVVTYGLESTADSPVDYKGRLIGVGQLPIRFEVVRRGELLGTAQLAIPGRYNVTNALGALAVVGELGVPFDVSVAALSEFMGLENRFSICRAGEITIVKDYISHPTGIRRVLESAGDLTSGRIFSVWKPYRYTLLQYLGDEYATSFEGSHEVLITTMYAAEEDPIPGIDTDYIVGKIRDTGMQVTYVPEDCDLLPELEKRVKPGDKVIFFGGDDFFRMADSWAQSLDSAT